MTDTINAKSLDSITTVASDDYFLAMTDTASESGTVEKITKEAFIADIISADSGNLLAVGADKNLKTFQGVIGGATEYGGTVVTDLNAITKNGFYTCFGDATGAPSSSYSWFVIHQNSNVGTANATQRAVAYNSTPIIYERVKTSSTWGSWTLQGSGSGGGGVTEFDELGEVTTNITLADNKLSMAYFSGSTTVTLPTISSTTNQVECVLDFTTASTGYPSIVNNVALTGTIAVTNGSATVTGTSTLFTIELNIGDTLIISSVEYYVSAIASNTSLTLSIVYAGTTASGLTGYRKILKWSDKNQGKVPSDYSILSGVRNNIVFKNYWKNSLIYWEAEYTTYGSVETAFARPNLSADGTLGGASFAVSLDGVYGSQYAYLAVDGSNSTYAESNAGPSAGHYIMYNPKPLKVSSFDIKQETNGILAGSVYGSNDNINYTFLNSWSNSNTTRGYTFPISVTNGGNFYKYHKIDVTSTASGSYTSIYDIGINATYIAT